MSVHRTLKRLAHLARVGFVSLVMFQLSVGGTLAQAANEKQDDLPPGPFQITGSNFHYDEYVASPVHRFYQMWQQLDCSAAHATQKNPSGSSANLFPWVDVTIGAGSNGKAQATDFNNRSTGEGSTAMGFYNVATGDAPYFKYLADHYAMSDNYHQPAAGGTGLDSIILGFGDALWFQNPDGTAGTPPHNQVVNQGTPDEGNVDEIENPNPQPGTNNWYTEDGYGSGGFGKPVSGGGSYSEPREDGSGTWSFWSELFAVTKGSRLYWPHTANAYQHPHRR
jgi:phospholipase C